MMHDTAAGMSRFQRLLQGPVRLPVKIHPHAVDSQHIVRPFRHQDIDRVRVIFAAAGDHGILKMQLIVVVFQIKHCRNPTLGQRTVGKGQFPLGNQ